MSTVINYCCFILNSKTSGHQRCKAAVDLDWSYSKNAKGRANKNLWLIERSQLMGNIKRGKQKHQNCKKNSSAEESEKAARSKQDHSQDAYDHELIGCR